MRSQRPPQTPGPANRDRNSLPWGSLEQQVVRMQKQISQASQRGDKQAVHTLQQRLMESEAARLLAVRRVTEENQGKDTAGVDGIKSLGPKERLAMASTIHPKYWNYQPPMPVRRVWEHYVDTCQEAERLLFLQGSQERRGSAWLHCWRHRASVRGLFHSKAPMFKKCLHKMSNVMRIWLCPRSSCTNLG